MVNEHNVHEQVETSPKEMIAIYRHKLEKNDVVPVVQDDCS